MSKLRRRHLLFLALAAVLLIGTAGAWPLIRNTPLTQVFAEISGRTTGELLRYAELRLSGHPKLETVLMPPIHWARDIVERKIPDLPPATLLRGARAEGLPAQRYGDSGEPLESRAGAIAAPLATRIVGTEAEFLKALAAASAGDVIELQPGRYTIRQNVWLNGIGKPSLPIVVRAAKLGEVLIEFEAVEGFVITQPYWMFENLHIAGICKIHDYCEHAFHIVGKARNTVLRNNAIRDFDSPVKINGQNGDFPDDGLIQHSHFFNTEMRMTSKPVVTIDLVAASRWRVVDNLIADFVVPSDRNPSYGVYMKGGGRDGRIERNLIVCQLRMQNQPGLRVGISFGGGRTGVPYRRDPTRESEHDKGVIANNVVAHCSDFGIDINATTDARIYHNTLINTFGISVRQAPASAVVTDNMIEGSVRARREGKVEESGNVFGATDRYFRDPDHFDFAWTKTPDLQPVSTTAGADFCAGARQADDAAGAFSTQSRCSVTGSPLSLRNPQ